MPEPAADDPAAGGPPAPALPIPAPPGAAGVEGPPRWRAVTGRLLRPDTGEARRSPVWIEVLLIIWLCWVYDAIANLAPLQVAAAHAHAGSILHIERALHIDPEVALDHWLSGHPTLGSALSNYYDNAHFVVTLGLIGVAWWLYPAIYRPLRNSLVLTNLIAMVVFWVLPTAPPRLYNPHLYLDVVAATHAFGSWHSGTLATAANELAAMPSLHLGWACWSSLAAWRILAGRRWRWLVWLYPLVTAVAVMATGNHWLLDVVAGCATLAVSTWIADRWQGWWTTRQAQRALETATVPVAAGEVERQA